MTNTPLLNLLSQPSKLASASLRDAIAQGEGLRIDFKSSFQKEVIETFVAYGLPEPVFEATQGGMATEYNVTQRTIERWLKQLKDQGQIEFNGAPKTGGYYATTGSQP